MEIIDVVEKLIGKINPIGETNTDIQRFENLKNMCDLAELIIDRIHDINITYEHSEEFSVKKASNYANNFLKNTLLINE